MGLFRTKSIEQLRAQADAPGHGLKRVLGAKDLVFLGIGAIIGAGIFSTVGTAAAGERRLRGRRAGAGPLLHPLGVVCGFAALCYAEFASMVPVSGTAYTYAYATLGELIAWIIGWDLIIEYAVGNVAVAISWSRLLPRAAPHVGIHLPGWLADRLPHGAAQVANPAGATALLAVGAARSLGIPILFNLPAFPIVDADHRLLVVGIRESARVNTSWCC